LERGQRVVLGLLIVGSEDLDRPADDAPEDAFHHLILRRRQGHKVSGTFLVEREDLVWRQRVEMYLYCPKSRADLHGGGSSPRAPQWLMRASSLRVSW
jgi:hypothetical protein